MLTTATEPMTCSVVTKIFTCSQCPKVFVTRSNLKRHMENPNIHNIPYVRCRDQKRWKGHSKKVISKEEITERMRKWRAENREKNRQNDLRCRVYRLARQKFGEEDSAEKQRFINDEIARRLGRRLILDDAPSSAKNTEQSVHHNNKRQQAASNVKISNSPVIFSATAVDRMNIAHIDNSSSMVPDEELPFYSAVQQKIELPSIETMNNITMRHNHYHHTLQQQQASPASASSYTASPTMLPDLCPHSPSGSTDIFLQRCTSNSTCNSSSIAANSGMMTPTSTSSLIHPHQKHDQGTNHSNELLLSPLLSTTSSSTTGEEDFGCVPPSMHKPLTPPSSAASVSSLREVNASPAIANGASIYHCNSNNILDEFVGVILDYADSSSSYDDLASFYSASTASPESATTTSATTPI